MKKNQDDNIEEEDTIIDNEFCDPIFMEENYESKPKIISFITEYMSLSLNDKIAKYLINKKIRSIKNPLTFDTLIHYLCINDENYPLIELINPNSREIELKNNMGQTPLHIAVQNRSYKISKFLIEKKANLQAKDNKNNTPLHIAVNNSDYDIVQLLMKNDQIINILNIDRETPLDIAKKNNDKKLINYLSSKCVINKKEKTGLLLKQKNEYLYKDKNNKSNKQNNSVINCSLETKNETDNQSFNIYKKKIVSKEKIIKGNKTISMNFNNQQIETPQKKSSMNSVNRLSPLITGPKLVYRKTSPKIINKQCSFIGFGKDLIKDEVGIYTRHISPSGTRMNNNINVSCLSYKTKSKGVINKQNLIKERYFIDKNYNCENEEPPKIKIIHYDKLKNKQNERGTQSESQKNNYCPISFKEFKDLESNNYKIKKVRKTEINNSPFSCYNLNNLNNIKKEDDLSKERLLEFLKEIGMQHYGDILISEGFDDINLIVHQMKEGFPVLDDTLKEIGISSPGDRAKILIRMQQVSNGFSFDFPFEQVFFKNNFSIQKWLNKEGLSKYINNFIDAGYQSLELLLIQMASKYKISDKILKNDIHIINPEDRKIILKSLEKNSQKYVYELTKNINVQRTFSKMVQKNTGSICIII